MTKVIIKKVENHQQRRQFATFPWQIYRHDPLWVPPLVPERMKQLNPHKGTFYHHGEADFFWPTKMADWLAPSWRLKTVHPPEPGTVRWDVRLF